MNDMTGRIKTGARIHHSTYGTGTVTKIIANENDAEFIIVFDNGNTQTLRKTNRWNVEPESYLEPEPIVTPEQEIIVQPDNKDTRHAMMVYVTWRKTLHSPKDGFGLQLENCETCHQPIVLTQRQAALPEKDREPYSRFCNGT